MTRVIRVRVYCQRGGKPVPRDPQHVVNHALRVATSYHAPPNLGILVELETTDGIGTRPYVEALERERIAVTPSGWHRHNVKITNGRD